MKKTPLKRKTRLKSKKPLKKKSPSKSKKTVKTRKVSKKRVCSPKTLKTNVWRAFSKYIRYQAADHAGYVTCVSCRQRFHWTGVDAGHYYVNTERNQQFGGNELWYSEKNINPQCRTCNSRHIHKERAKTNYSLWLEERYGYGILQELFKLKNKPKKFTRSELEALLEKYTNGVPQDIK